MGTTSKTYLDGRLVARAVWSEDLFCDSIFVQSKMNLQLYQVDQKSYLLDFKSLTGLPEPGEEESEDPRPPISRSDHSMDEKMDTDEDAPMPHCTLEFFEMCANLITALAR